MKLVVDTNVVVAAILKSGLTRELFFTRGLFLYSPDKLKIELLKYREEFMQKSGLTESEFNSVAELVLDRVKIVPIEEYEVYAYEAKRISPDDGDWEFFAVALCKSCALWSSEKKLKDQQRVSVYSTLDLLDLLRR